MKTKILAVVGLVALAGLLMAAVTAPPPSTTTVSEQFLTNATTAQMRTFLGFTTTNSSSITNYVGNGASITNIPGSSITGSLTNNTTGNATTATRAAGANNATNFWGSLNSSNLPSSPTVSGTVTAGAFVGDGSGLSGLPASGMATNGGSGTNNILSEPTMYDHQGNLALDLGNRLLVSDALRTTVDWNQRTLNDSGGNQTMNWETKTLTGQWAADGHNFFNIPGDVLGIAEGTNVHLSFDAHVMFINVPNVGLVSIPGMANYLGDNSEVIFSNTTSGAWTRLDTNVNCYTTNGSEFRNASNGFYNVSGGYLVAGVPVTPRTWTNGRTWFVATTGSNNTAAINDPSHPFAHLTNALSTFTNSETIVILDTGPYTVTNSYKIWTNAQVLSALSWTNGAPQTIVTNAVPRSLSGPGGSSGAMFNWSDNCIVKGLNLRAENVVTNHPPMIGTIYWEYFGGATNAAKINTAATNVTIADCMGRGTQILYVRHTNACSGVVSNVASTDFRQGLFSSFANHTFNVYNSGFSGLGPNPGGGIGGGSGISASVGARILSGTWNFYGCGFEAYNPTNFVAALSPTGAIALEVEVSLEGTAFFSPVVSCYNCTFNSGNTNATSNRAAYDIANGIDPNFYGESAILSLVDCVYNPSKVVGVVQDKTRPVSSPSPPQSSGELIVLGAGSDEINSSATTTYFTNATPLVGFYEWTNASPSVHIIAGTNGAWSIQDDIGDTYYTSTGNLITDGPWVTGDIGVLPVPQLITWRLVSAPSAISPNNLVSSSTISVGSSPFNYTNTLGYDVLVFVAGGTVSDISRNAAPGTGTIFSNSPATVPLHPSDWIRVTYSAAPAMRRVAF